MQLALCFTVMRRRNVQVGALCIHIMLPPSDARNSEIGFLH